MKIAYCDHSYHRKTRSTLFLPSLLASEGHTVDYFWDSGWEGGTPVRFSNLEAYDAIVIFQAIPQGLPDCVARHHPNVTFIPMLDQFGIAKGPLFDLRRLWSPFHGSKVLSFSAAVHAIATSNGIASMQCQYMPPNAGRNFAVDGHRFKDSLHAFFWARRPSEISIEMVGQLLCEQQADLSLHVHLPADPGEVETSEQDVRSAFPNCQSLTISHWLESKAEIMRIIRDCDVYIAPRLEEGIGQSFLEALSAGLCVVAPNNGTMNEYIVDGVNGMLYNPASLKPLTFKNIGWICENAHRTAAQLLTNWEEDQGRVLDFILKPSSECYGEQHIYHGIQKGKSGAIPFRLKREMKRVLRKIRG
ncbi:glycosyltransferase family 4 protein [Cyanobium gracile UHCC 0139]|uniref:Glycosyltransferase family 4 protein n=1 Tax=Cyanobium gracile UHCC 0139 TaxID=3110308 RepID=A0ABU5RR87_9CYAN|nr:glycosyltransferase family 4 protein [Cyanobium gracile]MEA5390274.1 glycosyltransferase family 4 protein [Cyanobium gracile UHCC 0139]